MHKKSLVPEPILAQQLMPFFPKSLGQVVFVAIPKGMLSEVSTFVLWSHDHYLSFGAHGGLNVTTAETPREVQRYLDALGEKYTLPTMVLVADVAAISLIPEHLLVTHVPSYRLDAPADYSWEIGAYDPRGMTWTAIHRLLGHDDYPNPFGRQIESYTALATNPHRTPFQQQKMEMLRAELDAAGVQYLATPVEQEKE